MPGGELFIVQGCGERLWGSGHRAGLWLRLAGKWSSCRAVGPAGWAVVIVQGRGSRLW